MTTAVVFGYHNVGVRCLSVLLAHGIDVRLVVTHTDNPAEKSLPETAIIKELIPHVDAIYRTNPTRDRRAIAGMSTVRFGAPLANPTPDFSAA